MKKLFLVLTLFAISSVVVFSQDDYKKGEFFVGFSRNQVDTGIERGDILGDPIPERQGFNGFEASGVYNVSRYIGIKGDVSGAYRTDKFNSGAGTNELRFDTNSSLYNVLGGIQIKDNSSKARVKPFVHALAGAGIARVKFKNAQCPNGQICTQLNNLDGSETGFAAAFGGGIDIKLSNRIDLRAIQVDYNPIRFDGATTNNIRIGVGIVFK